MATYTSRQQQILEQVGKSLGFGLEQVTSVTYEADIPVGVTYQSDTGSVTRQTYDQLGSILTNLEMGQLRDLRAGEQAALSTAFLAAKSLLGKSVSPLASDFVSSAGRNPVGTLAGAIGQFDPKMARLAAAGLGALVGATQLADTRVAFNASGSEDRVRISDPSGIFISSSNPILAPLATVGYVLFPYTPSISINHQANYDSTTLTHSNYTYPFY